MIELSDIERFNPWWKTGQVRKELLMKYKRNAFFDIERAVKRRQIALLWGLRRTGKTVIFYQLIEKLLKKEAPENILFFSFDEIRFDVEDILDTYQKMVLGKPFEEAKGKVFVFFDEIQKSPDWENKVKIYYDLYPNVKFFLSGSSSAGLIRGSKESLAGRIMEFALKPLSFEEFIEIRGKEPKKIKSSPELWKREIFPLFIKYLKYGTFPELADEEDEDFARKYILDNVIGRIIYRDLPEEFSMRDTGLLKAIIHIIGKSPGMLVNYKELSKSLGRDQRTVAEYFSYLELGLITKLVFNYRGSPLSSMKKAKKAYFSTPNLIFALNPDFEKVLPQILENAVLFRTEAEFFYRNGFEVDFIIFDKGKMKALEIKQKGKDMRQLKKFADKTGIGPKSCMLLDMENEGMQDGIRIMPVWKFLLSGSSD